MNVPCTMLHGLGGRVMGAALANAVALLLLALAASPAATAVPCTSRYPDMRAYAGKGMYESNFLASPLIVARLAALPAAVSRHLKRNLDVAGGVQLVACHLVVKGNAAHLGTEEDALLAVDLASGVATAAIHSRGQVDIYLLGDSAGPTPDAQWSALPGAVQQWAVLATMGFPSQHPVTFGQPSVVSLHAVAATVPATDGAPLPAVKVTANVKPNAAQAAAIARAAGAQMETCKPSGASCYQLSLADVNGDGRDDLLIYFTPPHAELECGRVGCGGVIVLATADGYAGKAIDLPAFHEMEVLPDMHQGMHDLQFDGNSPLWLWSGSAYAIEQGAGYTPDAGTTPWQSWQAAGRTLAKAEPINSTIRSLIVFCNQGQPVLAMLRKMPLRAQAVTLTWVFNGWTVNVPLVQGNREGTLWTADLARSPLPEWLAHRGSDATTSSLARAAKFAYLRIDGGMEGTISLADSASATRSALGSCYRY